MGKLIKKFKHDDFVDKPPAEERTQPSPKIQHMIKNNNKILEEATEQLDLIQKQMDNIQVRMSNAKKRIHVLNTIRSGTVGIDALWLIERIEELRESSPNGLDDLERDIFNQIEKK
ncbi:MAG: hypothetical protein U9P44_03460 [archaeon]|nr:hypothetical protein [archaeon]